MGSSLVIRTFAQEKAATLAARATAHHGALTDEPVQALADAFTLSERWVIAAAARSRSSVTGTTSPRHAARWRACSRHRALPLRLVMSCDRRR
jgi:hypothetical protein